MTKLPGTSRPGDRLGVLVTGGRAGRVAGVVDDAALIAALALVAAGALLWPVLRSVERVAPAIRWRELRRASARAA
jgi:hypothetical protein